MLGLPFLTRLTAFTGVVFGGGLSPSVAVEMLLMVSAPFLVKWASEGAGGRPLVAEWGTAIGGSSPNDTFWRGTLFPVAPAWGAKGWTFANCALLSGGALGLGSLAEDVCVLNDGCLNC